MLLMLTVENETAVLQLGLFLISFASNCYITAPIAGCGTFRLGTCFGWGAGLVTSSNETYNYFTVKFTARKTT